MMMMPKEDSAKINIDDYGSSRLLHDIEEISKALYLRDTQPKISNPPKYVKDNLLPKDKKSSIWKWKPLKALTHVRNQRLSCSFFLHIHSIEGLPLNLNGLNLCVYWKRKQEVLKSNSVRVKEGVAEFEETLVHRCSVYVSKRDPHDDVAKYAPKLSLLYVSVVGAPKLDIGKHWIDLTRLLPLTFTELEDEKNRYGKWITSFKLMGKAKGATINVSIGFSLSGDIFMKSGNIWKNHKGMLQRVGSIPRNSKCRTHVSNLSFDMKNHNTIVSHEGPSISLLYELLDDPKTSYSKELDSTSNEVYDGEFTVIDKGIEFSKEVENSCMETINVAELFDDDVCKESDNMCTYEYDEELELFLRNLSISETRDLDFSCHENQFLEHDGDMMNRECCEGSKMVKSHSLDELTSIVANDFMNLVGSDSDPESPRERLLKQFEQESFSSGNFVFERNEQINCSNILDSSFLFQETETEHNYDVGPSLISRRKAKMLENIETESLMEKWGLSERAFQNSPRTDSGAFGSPVYFSPDRQCELPPLGNGLGPFMKIENGGILRTMNPYFFKSAKNGEKLVVQVSNAIVLPPAMGPDSFDILMKWATVGPKKMLFQTTCLMPMEMITGKALQQAAWKAESEMDLLEREHELLHEPESKEIPTSTFYEIDSEYVSVDNIILLAIEKIQYLLIDGLRIQSGISNEDPPSIISSASTSNSEMEELVDMCISFDEWKKLDSANFDIKSEPFFNISGNSSYQNCGYFGNFTFALQLLLRDPLRDYEPVGIPMIALVQVERSTDGYHMFKVKEIQVNGFKADLQKKQQSGSRWLYSSGMNGKTKKQPLTKSTVLVKSSIQSMSRLTHEDTLWSISSFVHSGVEKYTRNPDIVFK